MRFYRTIALAGVSMVSIASPAFAAAAPAADAPPTASADDANTASVDPNQIIVSARRRDEKLQDAPLVVNAVSGQTLNDLNIHSFKDVTTVVPGLSLVANANGIGAQTSVRGVNHDVNVSGDNGTVRYYIDDAPVGADTVFQTIYDVDQVEVERGPQGTLRGEPAPSGAIAFRTHQPDLQEAGGFVDGTIGSASTANVSFAVGTPIIADKLAVRVAGVYDYNRGDRVYSVNNSAPPLSRSRSLRATVRFDPTDWFKSGFSFNTLDHLSQGYDQEVSFSQIDPTQPATAGTPSYGTIGINDRKSVEFIERSGTQSFKRYAWHAQLNLAGQSLYYVGNHVDNTYDVTTPQDQGGLFPALTNVQHTLTINKGTTHELRLQSNERVAGIFDYVIGYFHSSASPSTALTQGQQLLIGLNLPGFFFPIGPPSLTQVSISLPQVTTKEESFFGNLTAHLGEGTEISGGLRRYKLTDPGQTIFVNGSVISPATQNNLTKTIYNFVLRHRFSDNLMVYASTGSSVRPGAHAIGDFSAAAFSPNEQAHTTIAPETSKNYEIGFKSSLLDKTLTFNGTYYHQDYTNYPFRAAGQGVQYITTSAAGAQSVAFFNFISAVPVKVNGFEGELDYRPSHDFYLNTTVNYAKSKLGNSQVACNLLPGTPTLAQLQAAFAAAGYPTEHLGVCSGAGQSAQFQPNFSASMLGEYSHQLGGGRVEGFLRGLMQFHGSTQNDPGNPFDNIGSYAIFNAYVGVRGPNGAWSLTFYGKNLGNTTKLVTLNGSPYTLSQTNVLLSPVNFSPVGTTNTTYTSSYGAVTVTPPREFGVNLRIAFGSR